jgi:hypothetical protein
MEIKDSSKFKAEILSRMEKEVLSQEKDLTKESMYETLLKINSFSAPKVTYKGASRINAQRLFNENRASKTMRRLMIYFHLMHLWRMLKKGSS